jgi:hypothetical protein
MKHIYYLPLYILFIPFILLSSGQSTLEESSSISLSNIHRVISLSVIMIFFIFYIIKNKKINIPPELFRSYGIYILIGIISALLFSNALVYSMWKLFELTAMYLLVLYIWMITKKNFDYIYNFYDKTLLFMKVLLFSLLFSMVLDPSNAFERISAEGAIFPYRLQGTIVVLNSISIGTFSAFFIYDYVIKFIYKCKFKPYDYVLFSYFFILLFLSQSRTPIIAIIIVLGMFFIITNKIKAINKFVFTIPIVFLFIIVSPILLALLQRGASTDQLLLVTGRMTWWKYALEVYSNSSWMEQLIGMGFTSAEREIAASASGGMMMTLDSSFMSLLVSVGSIGLFIMCYIFLVLFRRYKKAIIRFKSDYRFAQIFGIIFLIFLKSFTTLTVNLFSIYTLLFLISILMISHKTEYKANIR